MTDARELIDRYFDLAPRPDADAYFAQFADDAVVEDDGQAHRGIAAIRAWRSKVPRVAYTIHDVKTASTGHDAAVSLGDGRSRKWRPRWRESCTRRRQRANGIANETGRDGGDQTPHQRQQPTRCLGQLNARGPRRPARRTSWYS